jgi:hypothetical protein
MRILRCVVALAFIIAAAPAWAADPSPGVVLAQPDTTFRTPGGETPTISGVESSSPSSPIGSPGSLASGTGEGLRLLDSTPVTLHYPPTVLMAQATGAPSPAPAASAAEEPNPWIFGATLYFWIPFATSTSTVDGLPEGTTHSTFSSEVHVTNLYGGAGEFQLTKGDWGVFGNIAGSFLGLKGTVVGTDNNHPNQVDRTGYTHDGSISGQYGLSYRLLGRPLDLTTWARGTQPVSLDLLAGGQTFFVSSSVNTNRDDVSVSVTLTSPLVAARLGWDMTDRWNLGFIGSIGGFGVSDTKLTWQTNLTVAYRMHMWSVPGALTLGFRVEGLNFDSGSGNNRLKVKEVLYGPMLGLSAFF